MHEEIRLVSPLELFEEGVCLQWGHGNKCSCACGREAGLRAPREICKPAGFPAPTLGHPARGSNNGCTGRWGLVVPGEPAAFSPWEEEPGRTPGCQPEFKPQEGLITWLIPERQPRGRALDHRSSSPLRPREARVHPKWLAQQTRNRVWGCGLLSRFL